MRISDWSSDVCSSDLTDLYSRRAREDVSALCDPWGRPRRTAAGCGNRQGRDGGADRRCAALGAERSLVAAAARSGDRDGVGLDAGAPAGAAADGRTAARDFGSCRLGRTDGDDRRGESERDEIGKAWCRERVWTYV